MKAKKMKKTIAKKPVKKVIKKTVKKKPVKRKPKKSTALVVAENKVVDLEGQMKAMSEKGKYMIANSPITKQQVLKIFQQTPPEHIRTRPGKGGGQWHYVTGVYTKKVLNYVFGWLWDFQIVDKGREDNQVWVQGRLTIKNEKLETIIVKEQFGGADVKFKKGTKIPLDYPNDLKAASTDALKKCASEIGIANDIYGREEFKGVQESTPPPQVLQAPPAKDPEKIVDYMDQVKKRLYAIGGTTEKKALKILKDKTGLIWKDFKVTQKQAQIALGLLLNNQ
ncbi:hypothetical protein KA005_83580 [bacterium]|nr:hypothetical protein [bacterium]